MQIGGQPFLNLGLGDWIAFRIRIDVFSLRREFMAVPITVRCGTWNCDTDELRRPYFTVEYCVLIAEMAVYQWLGIDREIPPVK